MFDGNYRSTKRQVNLGGKSTRHKSKESILERTSKQRQERQFAEQKRKAATRLQMRIRGIQSRRRVAILLDQQESSDFDTFLARVNLRFGLPNPDSTQLLSKLAERIQNEAKGVCTISHAHTIQAALEYLTELPQPCRMILQFYTGRQSWNERLSLALGKALLLHSTTQHFDFLYTITETSLPPSTQKQALQATVLLDHQRPVSSEQLHSLMTILKHTPTDNKPLIQFIQQQMQSDSLQHILQHHDLPFAAQLQFIKYVWNESLQQTTGFFVRGGEDPNHLQEDTKDETEDDSDSEPDKKMENAFLTTPKLDRMYQTMKRDSRRNRNLALTNVAKEIADPQRWIRGVDLLRNDDASAKEDYVQILAALLDTCTGLSVRHSSSSPFLRQLAFSDNFVEDMWEFAMTLPRDSCLFYQTMTIFSDVFAQKLIALRDQVFLQRYTGDSCRMNVSDAVDCLRDVLYEQYYLRPVKVQDFDPSLIRSTVQVNAARARLLLNGTKVWNSLYERWCRLYPKPFCPESVWCFPNITVLSGDNAVRDNAAEGMDMDSDEDQSMEDAEMDALASTFSDPKMARILTCIPQALPFDRRVRLFDTLLKQDKSISQDERSEMQQAMIAMMRGEENIGPGREEVEIHRDQIYDDSMRQLSSLGSKLKRRVRVTFVNRHGAQEAGIDGGGVFKEFIDDLIKEAFLVDGDPSIPKLFTVTPLENLAVNVEKSYDRSLLPHYEFLGRVMGKAVYESILVEPQFCLPFLNQLLGKQNSLEDLKNYDPEYYSNLTKLLSLENDTLENLGLTFETTIGSGSTLRTFDLVPNGKNRPVNKSNVVEYVYLVTHYRLNVQSSLQVKAFLRGFRDLIPAPWVRIFSAHELQKLISGDDSVRGIDVVSLKASMQYASGYHPSQPFVQYFWEIVEEMNAEEQRKFLKFMTSCSRQPLLGFASLEPAPCLQQIRLPDPLFEEEASVIEKQAPLPTSSTCMNLLKLPNYRSKELMRKKLLAAIESGAGFELS